MEAFTCEELGGMARTGKRRVAWRRMGLAVFVALVAGVAPLRAQEAEGLWKGLVHGVEAEARPEYVFQTNPFLRGSNMKAERQSCGSVYVPRCAHSVGVSGVVALL